MRARGTTTKAPATSAARGPVEECVEAVEVEWPCAGLLVNKQEGLELLRIKNVELPTLRLEWKEALDNALEVAENCNEDLNDALALAEARGQLLSERAGEPSADTGHSTWTVIGWTALGLGIGFLGGALVAKTAWR
jgi:hypothetical protein